MGCWCIPTAVLVPVVNFTISKHTNTNRLSLAWVLAQGEDIIPIPGTKQRKYLQENTGAVNIGLSTADLQQIENLLQQYPVEGSRISEGAMKLVNH